MNKRTRSLSLFAKTLRQEWARLNLPPNANVLLAVSGGADSTALLLAFNELTSANKLDLNISVVHVDHSLRKASREDAEWVCALATKLRFGCLVKSANVRKRVKETGDNLEQAARLMRYECLKQAAEELNAEILVTAHTLDDQAETIIMRLLRGSGAEGLSGIEPVRRLDDVSKLLIARPLVSWARRDETEQYCRKHKVRFRVDEMNDDVRFTRVRIRKELMPLMSSFNRKFVETLARTAALLREDASALSSEAEALLDTARNGDETQPGSLSVNLLRQAPAAVRRRALRQWIASASGHLKRVEMVHLLSIDKILESSKGTVVEMPRGIRISRKGGRLYISVKKVEKGVSGL